MKLPTAGGIITILGNQKEARRCEDNVAYAMKNVHAIEAVEAEEEEDEGMSPKPDEAYKPEGVTQAEHTKKILLCKDIPGHTVIIDKGLEEAEEARLI